MNNQLSRINKFCDNYRELINFATIIANCISSSENIENFGAEEKKVFLESKGVKNE